MTAGRPRVRWARVFLASTMLLAAALAWQLGREGSRRITFEAFLPPGTTAWVLERTGSLRVPAPPPDEEPSFDALRGLETVVRARLPGGHYRLSLSGGAGGIVLPLLVEPWGEPIAWDLRNVPPPGFVPVPPGRFLRGPRGPAAETHALVYAARHEVTRDAYAEFLRQAIPRDDGFSPYCSREERAAWPEGCPGHGPAAVPVAEGVQPAGDWPVTGVNWYDAMAFARYLTDEPVDASWAYRLPTALEWDKMARGTDGRVHPWGDEDRSDPFRDAAVGLQAVTSRPELASPYGLLHMESNAAEWMLDAVDPAGVRRLVRGRSFNLEADLVRFDVGVGDPAARRSPEVGFRLVVEPRS